MLELERITGGAENRRLIEQVSYLAKELNEARIKLSERSHGEGEIEELHLRIAGLEENLGRRDEQIEFLMAVHDASAEKEWVEPWLCPSCTFSNKHGSETCEVCGVKKPSEAELSKASATAGLSTTTCGACTYENEAGMTKCAMCGHTF